MSAATAGVVLSSFLACFVEMVEATTIVLAMGVTRGWRSALAGTAAALGVLAVVTLAAGYAITHWLPEAALQLVVGGLLLVFGLQWLRKAVLRSSGRKAVHDEDAIFRGEVAQSRAAGSRRVGGLDAFGVVVAFKGVLLEGAEVVFIVVTFGANASQVPAAAGGAVVAAVVVLALAAALRRPLAMIDENLLKYLVGLMLASFGTFWSLEGLGSLTGGAIGWPGGQLAILGLVAGWLALTRVLVRVLRAPAPQPVGAP